MSERMTSEADEIAKNIIHNGGIPKDYAKHALDIINPQLVTLAKAHLRSQTPPHAVTRDMRCGHGYDNYIMCPICAPGPFACDALAEKPAPTPTPLTLTGEDRAFLTGLISHHKERRHDVVVQTLTELRERLSASPTAPQRARTPGTHEICGLCKAPLSGDGKPYECRSDLTSCHFESFNPGVRIRPTAQENERGS